MPLSSSSVDRRIPKPSMSAFGPKRTCIVAPHMSALMRAFAKTGTLDQTHHAHAWAPAALACLGVVFGDIGTSPLYAHSVAVKATSTNGQISPEAILGVVSLIFWSLIVVI